MILALCGGGIIVSQDIVEAVTQVEQPVTVTMHFAAAAWAALQHVAELRQTDAQSALSHSIGLGEAIEIDRANGIELFRKVNGEYIQVKIA